MVRPTANLACVIGQGADEAQWCWAGTTLTAMSLRTLAAFGLVLLLWGCSVPKPTDATVNEIERRHDDMMMRGLGGNDGGNGM
jgi:hypothetical protein